jgi:t-SNARE complex subunit (syntaxin)
MSLMFAQESRKELLEIEKKLCILQQMTIDLGTILQGQTEILDNVAKTVENTVCHTTKSLKMLQIAEKRKIAARKKKIIAGVIVVVVVGVVVVTVVGITAGVICMMG